MRAELPPEVFRPAPLRALWLFVHVAVVVAGFDGLAHRTGGALGALVCVLLVGHSYACLSLVAHEAMHGATVRGRRLRYLVGFVGFLPFVLSPRIWSAWHNRVHHGHTMEFGVDPDTWPTLAQYRADRFTRALDHVAFGERRPLGVVTLLVGFSLQSLQIMVRTARRFVSPRDVRRGLREALVGVAIWTTVALAVGGRVFLLGYAAALVVANVVLIGYIITNHGLSPLTETNDPLLNSLSVTTARPLELLHLQFGYHVEHHLFPAMSQRHSWRVREVLRHRFPERYQSMPHHAALAWLLRTPRVYLDGTTLVSPTTGDRARPLLPRDAALPRLDAPRAASSAAPPLRRAHLGDAEPHR